MLALIRPWSLTAECNLLAVSCSWLQWESRFWGIHILRWICEYSRIYMHANGTGAARDGSAVCVHFTLCASFVDCTQFFSLICTALQKQGQFFLWMWPWVSNWGKGTGRWIPPTPQDCHRDTTAHAPQVLAHFCYACPWTFIHSTSQCLKGCLGPGQIEGSL